MIVTYTDATRRAGSLTNGKRIFMCGTTEDNRLFFAVHNTVFNLTEYVYEDPLPDTSVLSESCKDIHINTDTGHLLIITQRTSADSAASKSVYIRGFSLESNLRRNVRNGH